MDTDTNDAGRRIPPSPGPNAPQRGALAKQHKRSLWPPEVRDKKQGLVFWTPRHTLHDDGRTYQLEIRSRKGSKTSWIMVDKLFVVQGPTRAIALANVVKAIDPEVEEVRDQDGRALA